MKTFAILVILLFLIMISVMVMKMDDEQKRVFVFVFVFLLNLVEGVCEICLEVVPFDQALAAWARHTFAGSEIIKNIKHLWNI